MPPGPRTHRQASLRVCVAEGVPSDLQNQIRELVSLQSGNPRKGDATALMHVVCTEADFAWLTLLVHAEPFAPGMTQDRLEHFYGKFNFVVVQREPVVLMARSPRKPLIFRSH